mmetsp:Transcript_11432/g.17298  ORF Transcript_11432/g.17298 Transcript_11432/m.17298 type:complete len:431 (+) Transcript_11432:131-1423(+)
MSAFLRKSVCSLSLIGVAALLFPSYTLSFLLRSSAGSTSCNNQIQPNRCLFSTLCSSTICNRRQSASRNLFQPQRKSILRLSAVNRDVEPNRRKKKKNKYAKFSKVDQQLPKGENDKNTVDPFEALLAESEEKNKQLQKEMAMKKNKKLSPDLLDEETIEKLKTEKRERNKRMFPDNRSIDPYDPTTYGYTELGTILGPHGVHGLVKVSAVTDFPERLCKPGIRHLKAPNRRSPREIRIVEGRHRLKEEYLVKLEQVGDRNDALKLRGSILYARQEERPDTMDDNEYLITDLVGLEVRLVTGYGEDADELEEDYNGITRSDEGEQNDALSGKFVGVIGGIVLGEEMCSVPGLGQDLLEIVLPKGKQGTPSWRDEMVLIPFVPSIVPTIDIETEVIYINPPKGLLDLTYVKEEKIRIKGFLPEKSSWVGKR